MAAVVIKMPSGSVQCVGAVVRLQPSGAVTPVADGVAVRKAKASPLLQLDRGHYQFRFTASGGVGAFSLEATDASQAIVGSSSYAGTIQLGLVLDIQVL